MKGCLIIIVVLFLAGIGAMVLENFCPPVPPPEKPTATSLPTKTLPTSAAPISPLPSSSKPTPTPTPAATPMAFFPDRNYWPATAHLTKPVAMKGSGGKVTMTVPAGTEVAVSLVSDLKTIEVRLKEPALEAVTALGNTDFEQVARKNQETDLAKKKEVAAKQEAEILNQRRLREIENASYGPIPFYDEKEDRVDISENLLRVIKSQAKDPSSVKIREILCCEKSTLEGQHCWHMQLKVQGTNGFGGPSLALVDVWYYDGRYLKMTWKE